MITKMNQAVLFKQMDCSFPFSKESDFSLGLAPTQGCGQDEVCSLLQSCWAHPFN